MLLRPAGLCALPQSSYVRSFSTVVKPSAFRRLPEKESHVTPSYIKRALDEYIVGQDAAKRAISVAVRNRFRRLLLPAEIRKDARPHNVLMIGPTGVSLCSEV